MKTQEYLSRIRMNGGLRNAIISKITVDERKNSVEFYLITDKSYTQSEADDALRVTKSFLPEGVNASVKISKLVADGELIAKKIIEILKSHFPAAASFVGEKDVTVEKSENGANFYIEIGTAEQGLFRTGNVLDVVAAELSKKFCGSFIGNVRAVEREEEEFVPDSYIPPKEYEIPIRVFPVTEYSEIDGGEKPKFATYIVDVSGENDDLTLCGEIIDIREKETSSGKPFFVFNIDDKTGIMKVTYFSKKKSIDKVRELKVGDKIVCRGDYTAFRDNLSYTARHINRGSYPENFVPEAKAKKGVPEAYKKVFPEQFTDYNQDDLFSSGVIPPFLKNNEFVVYDIETTGLNSTGLGGTMDAIIELGAAKIKNGAICEKFSTFVSADRRLSAEIVKLTGITDDMLKGAPTIKDVIADFYKFCDGACMVGHNSIGFDIKFINFYANQNDYAFKNKQYDTLHISQKNLRLANYKLNTIADYYGISFNHHRAFDDALTTAKIFINLVKEFGVE